VNDTPGEAVLELSEEPEYLEEALQKNKRKAFKLDLTELHAVCEANYARLLRLFPDYENRNVRDFLVGAATVRLAVVERCRYTTIFRIEQQRGESRWLGQLRLEVRAYHDARMLEVGMFQSHRRVAARYDYPNDKMFAQDEKYQQNRFLSDWLEHCQQNGRVALDIGAPVMDT
jgi:uncharacterized protein YqiB (DUF1249 family)